MNDVLMQINSSDMYIRAKSQGLRFFQFQEWVENDINKTIYKNQDHDFIAMESDWLN